MYFSRSADRTCPAMVATAEFLHGSDLLCSLESPSVPPSGRLVAASHAQAGGSRGARRSKHCYAASRVLAHNAPGIDRSASHIAS